MEIRFTLYCLYHQVKDILICFAPIVSAFIVACFTIISGATQYLAPAEASPLFDLMTFQFILIAAMYTGTMVTKHFDAYSFAFSIAIAKFAIVVFSPFIMYLGILMSWRQMNENITAAWNGKSFYPYAWDRVAVVGWGVLMLIIVKWVHDFHKQEGFIKNPNHEAV